MIRKTRRSLTPGIGRPATFGNQGLREVVEDVLCRTPIRARTRSAIPKEVKPRKSAAARAGTTWRGRLSGSSDVIFPRAPPAHRPPRSPARCWPARGALGESPTSIPPRPFSDAARVARPNRVQLDRPPPARRRPPHQADEDESRPPPATDHLHDGSRREERRLRRLRRVAEGESGRGLRKQQHAERGHSFPSGAAVRSGRKTISSTNADDREHEQQAKQMPGGPSARI